MNILEEIQNCPVEWKELGEISQLYGGLTGKTKSDFENGNAKYVTYKNIFNNIQVKFNILENVQVDENEKQNAIKYGDVLITSSSENKEEVGMSSAVTFVSDEPIYINSFSFGIRFNEDVELIPEFTKYLFRSFGLRKQIEKTASGVTRYNISKVAFKKIKVPLIPKEIQEKIVQILDKMTEYVTELTSELTSRKKQYSFYRDKLLSFEDEVYQVEWKTIQDISVKIVTGVTPKKSCEDYYLKGTIPWLRTNEVKFNTITTTEKYVTERAVEETGLKWISPNSIIIAISGATAGRVAMNSIPLTTNQHCCSISVDERIVNYKYLYYWLVNQNRQILSLKQGARGDINMSMIKSLKIPVPSLEIQSRIIQVLDNFDTVCNDLNIGLPKEIELRQKQYEYFRDKLLTFVAEGEYTDSTVQYSTDKT